VRVESGGVGRVTLLRCAQAVARRLSISTSDPMVLEGAKYIAAPTAAPPSGWRDLDTAYAAPPRRLSNAFLFVFLFVLLIRPSYSSFLFVLLIRPTLSYSPRGVPLCSEGTVEISVISKYLFTHSSHKPQSAER